MSKTIEEILQDLEDSINNVDMSEAEVKAHSAQNDDLVRLNRRVEETKTTVSRAPMVKEEYRHYIYHTRYEYYANYLANVDYSKTTRKEYIQGHLEALNKYAQQSEVNNRNLVIVEAILKDEIKRKDGYKDTYYAKGYYDGLKYVLGAINYSKQKMMVYVNDRLKEEL